MPYVTEFRVKGKGFFPNDMLRYLKPCQPRTGDDQDSINATPSDWPGEREVELVKLSPNHRAAKFLAPDRWQSFGWQVVAVRKHYHVPEDLVKSLGFRHDVWGREL